MGLRERRPGGGGPGKAEDEDEQRRLSVFHLVGLAAGGVIGSGWMLAAVTGSDAAGSDAYLAWLLGGLLMLVVAGVMVELGTAAPKTGGLIFLPLQSSGALVATVVAAGLWLVYAINLASEAVAMTKGLAWRFDRLLDASGDTLTAEGWGCAVAFMLVMSALNLVAPRIFFRINSGLTVLKVAVPVLVLALLLAAAYDQHAPPQGSVAPGKGMGAALAAVVGSGVVFSYVGFQGPLDYAGNVKRRGVGEAVRLRWAVYGTVVGTIVLYLALQYVFTLYQGDWDDKEADSPYAQFAFAALGSTGVWLGWLLRITAVLSPMGAGLVFANALTREVAALSRAHLTHRGLQTARMASLLRRYDVYWLVVAVDFVIAVIALLALGGKWVNLVAASSVPTLVVYAIPSVVLVSLRDHLTGCTRRRRRVRDLLGRASFALIALVLYAAGWDKLWPGMAVFAVGCVLLLSLPVLARRLPFAGRVYDAKEHVTLLRQWRTSPAAQGALWLVGHLAVLTLLTRLGNPKHGGDHRFLLGGLAVAAALVAFEGMVRTSKRHLAEVAPLLPTPATATGGAAVPAVSAASG